MSFAAWSAGAFDQADNYELLLSPTDGKDTVSPEAVLGAHGADKSHAELILPTGHLHSCCQAKPARCRRWAAQAGASQASPGLSGALRAAPSLSVLCRGKLAAGSPAAGEVEQLWSSAG